MKALSIARTDTRGPMFQELDLFGQTPVTWPEVFDWCESVPGLARDSPRVAEYIRAWDVPRKVAAAKERNYKKDGSP